MKNTRLVDNLKEILPRPTLDVNSLYMEMDLTLLNSVPHSKR